jgi:LmbE family N-acetylglucosaminyl deacetylase
MLDGRKIVVLSPHLDDAVFSLGASIAEATRAGKEVRVVTVFAGDPRLPLPAAWWDRATGFATFAEAARARREEDSLACGLIGATPVWLPFGDATYEEEHEDDKVWSAVAEAVGDADAVLTPGFPLVHVDHAWLTRLVLERRFERDPRVGLYVEQPYAWRRGERPGWTEQLHGVLPEAPPWRHSRASRRDRRMKRRAFRCYASQLPMFGRQPLLRIALREAIGGGEGVAWLTSAGPVEARVRSTAGV